jgi:hypothetical protein
MVGTTAAGLPARKAAPQPVGYQKPLDEAVARDLRRALHHGLRLAGYTAPQIAQLTGHSGRTIRRDLATPNAPRDGGDRRTDPRRPRGDRDRRPTTDRPWPSPRRLTTREIQDLRDEYGSGELATPEVRAFIESLPPATAG